MKATTLQERAMLVNLRMSTWTGRAKDSAVTHEVTENKGAEDESGAWWTYFVPRQAIATLKTKAIRCRLVHYKYTLPWLDGGVRILPATMFLKYGEELRKAVAEYDAEVVKFLVEYPKYVETAKERLGKLADGKSMPSVFELKTKFGAKTDMFALPVTPDAKEFRMGIPDKDKAEVQQQMEDSSKRVMEHAMSSIWKELRSLVSKIEGTMSQPDKAFRDTLITNLKEYVEMIPALNITDDKQIEEMRKEVTAKLVSLDIVEVKGDKKLRKRVHKDASDMLAKMKGYARQA